MSSQYFLSAVHQVEMAMKQLSEARELWKAESFSQCSQSAVQCVEMARANHKKAKQLVEASCLWKAELLDALERIHQKLLVR
mmetsp:Transcript_25025/g.35284  ORF Transcript_25025/g.35284 Transcript_25025/m.35284 type:complete len:82 (-) Transcript_25025:370-615(-)